MTPLSINKILPTARFVIHINTPFTLTQTIKQYKESKESDNTLYVEKNEITHLH